MVAESVAIKEEIVEEDPQEHGIRKALNLGHTIGHAFESWAMREAAKADSGKARLEKPILHGYAVAYGIVAELYLAASCL